MPFPRRFKEVLIRVARQVCGNPRPVGIRHRATDLHNSLPNGCPWGCGGPASLAVRASDIQYLSHNAHGLCRLSTAMTSDAPRQSDHKMTWAELDRAMQQDNASGLSQLLTFDNGGHRRGHDGDSPGSAPEEGQITWLKCRTGYQRRGKGERSLWKSSSLQRQSTLNASRK